MYSVGQSIGSYTIIRPLGSGRTVDVYEAQHPEQQRRVALKVLQSRYVAIEENVSRFIAEYRAVNCLLHPAVAETYECGRLPDGTTFAATEFLAGETLEERLGRELPDREGLLIARQIASVLTMAHACGILHRDLRPENIVLCSNAETSAIESVRVVDFGIARFAEESGGRAGTSADATPSRYTAPEKQKRTQPAGPKADVYAFGVLLQDLLGVQPGSGRSALAAAGLAEATSTTEKPSGPASDSEGKDEITQLVTRMLAAQPSERPAMAEVRHTLERIWRARGESSIAGAHPPQRRDHGDTGHSAAEGDESLEHSSKPSGQRLGADDPEEDDEAHGGSRETADRPSDEAVIAHATAAPPPRLAIAFAVLGLGMGLLAAGIAYRRSVNERPTGASVSAAVTQQQPVVASLLTVVVDPMPAPANPSPKLRAPAGMIEIAAADGTTGGGTGQPLWVDQADVDNASFAAWLNTVDVTVRKERFVYLAERRVLDLRSKGSGLRWLRGNPRPSDKDTDLPAGRSGGRFVARLGKEGGAIRYVDTALGQAFCAARDAQLPTPEQVTWLLRRGDATAAVWGAPLSLTAAHGFRCVRPAGPVD